MISLFGNNLYCTAVVGEGLDGALLIIMYPIILLNAWVSGVKVLCISYHRGAMITTALFKH